MAKEEFEIWAIHERIGKRPWKQARWFSPTCGPLSKEGTKRIAAYMNKQHDRRKHKAVRYVPSQTR